MLADRQTDRHTDRRADHNTPHPYRGGVTQISANAQIEHVDRLDSYIFFNGRPTSPGPALSRLAQSQLRTACFYPVTDKL